MIQYSCHPGIGRSRSAGFTLVELMIVVVLMGIISVTVIPAMDNLSSIREGAARDDIVRMIEVTKGRAVASGMPHGLNIDLANAEISIYEMTDEGEIEVEIDPLTNDERLLHVSSIYPGVTLSSFINGDGSFGSAVLWFDYESNPHMRNSDGTFRSLNSEPAVITISSGEQILVHHHSGMVEVR